MPSMRQLYICKARSSIKGRVGRGSARVRVGKEYGSMHYLQGLRIHTLVYAKIALLSSPHLKYGPLGFSEFWLMAAFIWVAVKYLVFCLYGTYRIWWLILRCH